MTLVSRLFDRLFPADPDLGADLIDDPVFRAMSLRELADLPFPRPTPREEDEDAVVAAGTQPVEPYEIHHAA